MTMACINFGTIFRQKYFLAAFSVLSVDFWLHSPAWVFLLGLSSIWSAWVRLNVSSAAAVVKFLPSWNQDFQFFQDFAHLWFPFGRTLHYVVKIYPGPSYHMNGRVDLIFYISYFIPVWRNSSWWFDNLTVIESDSDGGSVQQLREAEKGARKKSRKKSVGAKGGWIKSNGGEKDGKRRVKKQSIKEYNESGQQSHQLQHLLQMQTWEVKRLKTKSHSNTLVKIVKLK